MGALHRPFQFSSLNNFIVIDIPPPQSLCSSRNTTPPRYQFRSTTHINSHACPAENNNSQSDRIDAHEHCYILRASFLELLLQLLDPLVLLAGTVATDLLLQEIHFRGQMSDLLALGRDGLGLLL